MKSWGQKHPNFLKEKRGSKMSIVRENINRGKARKY